MDDHDHMHDDGDGDGRYRPSEKEYLAEHKYGGGYSYRPGELLIGGPDRHEVLRSMKLRLDPGRPTEELGRDLLRVHLVDKRSVPAVVADYLARDQEAPPTVSPNHVLFGGGHMVPFPGGAPQRWASSEAQAAAPPEDDPHGRGVVVAVLDSGVDPDHSWLRPPHVERTDPNAFDEPEPDGGGHLRRYAGHGTHIAGVIRRHAPGATVLAHKLFGGDGVVDDVTLSRALEALPDVHVVNLSLGGYSHGDFALPATASVLAEFRVNRPETVVVASAGNDGHARPVWPAAFKQVVAVGALGPDGARACFSNFGWWVDAASVGIDVESSFVRFDGEPEPVPHRKVCPKHKPTVKGPFEGFAYWSGTSFAAPKVAAAIACAIGDGLNGPEAVFRLIDDPAVTRLVDLGSVVEPKPIL